MSWSIICEEPTCPFGGGVIATNIHDLLRNHRRHKDCRFHCRCGEPGHIVKSYKLLGKGEHKPWAIELIGAILPAWAEADPDGTYQPFMFITREADTREFGLWCRYFKRLENGNIKFGDGPGGGPAFSIGDLRDMVARYDRVSQRPSWQDYEDQ